MRDFSFDERLSFSQGRRRSTDVETLRVLIPGCESVRSAGPEHDRMGIDYIAVLRSGVELFIDAKTRDEGCVRWWKNRDGAPDGEPDLALERWSVVPDHDHSGTVGWTLDDRKWTELVLFTFAPSDTSRCYLVSFQHLRMAMLRYGVEWEQTYGGLRYQRTDHRYGSACIFVPVRVVMKAIATVSIGDLVTAG